MKKLNQELESAATILDPYGQELKKAYFEGQLKIDQILLEKIDHLFTKNTRLGHDLISVLEDIIEYHDDYAQEAIEIVAEKGLKGTFIKRAAASCLLRLAQDPSIASDLNNNEAESKIAPEKTDFAREKIKEAILDDEVADAVISQIDLKKHTWLSSFIKDNLETIEKRLCEKNGYNNYIPFLIQLMREQMFGDIELSHKVEPIIPRYLNQFGLRGEKIFQTWQNCRSEIFKDFEDSGEEEIVWDQFTFDILDNIRNMKELEDKRPSSVQELNQRFNIECFSRYKSEDLINQYDQRNNHQQTYGVIIYPKDDWNGAFYEDAGLLHKLVTELDKRGVGTRIIEAESKLEIFHILSRLDKRYNQSKSNPMKYAFIGGHGSKRSIQFGHQAKERNTLTTSDFLNFDSEKEEPIINERRNRVHEKIKSFFVDNPRVVLFSCYTGQNEGIAQKLSDQYESTVTGPNQPGHPLDISVDDQPNGDFDIRIIYNLDDQMTYIRGLPIKEDEQKQTKNSNI